MRTSGKKIDYVKEGTFRVSFTEGRRYKTEFCFRYKTRSLSWRKRRKDIPKGKKKYTQRF